MKNLKRAFLLLTWIFGAFFSITFWIAIGVLVALAITKPLIIAVDTIIGILILSFILFLVSAILTYILDKQVFQI